MERQMDKQNPKNDQKYTYLYQNYNFEILTKSKYRKIKTPEQKL